MTVINGSREDQYNVTVTMAYGGVTKDLGTFDTLDGGEVDSDDTKYFPGGMQQQISLGGRAAVGNVTVGRIYDLARDHPIMGWVLGGVGCAEVTVTKTSMTACSPKAVEHPLVYKGKVKTVTPPSHDANSTDAAIWTMEVSAVHVSQST